MKALRWFATQLLEESASEEELPEESSPHNISPAPALLVSTRQRRLAEALEEAVVDKRQLASILWSGVAAGTRGRCEAWQLLLGYRPLAQQRRARTLSRKRLAYIDLRRRFYDSSPALAKLGRLSSAPSDLTSRPSSPSWSTSCEEETLEQIRRDLPRTVVRGPHELASAWQALVDDCRVRSLMERVLFVWAVRQPAAGYVQGLHDVLLPLLLVFLAEAAGLDNVESLRFETLDTLPSATFDEVEADSYWCLAKVLSEVVDHYTDGQPGLQRAAAMLRTILSESDAALVEYLEDVGMEMGMDFLTILCMRWIGCLMVRELPMQLCIRLWDTCIAESTESGSGGFASFPIYFCAGFLLKRSVELRAGAFDDIMAFVQQPPTDILKLPELEATISRAYILMTSAQDHPGRARRNRSSSCSSNATEEAKPDVDSENGHITSFDHVSPHSELSTLSKSVAMASSLLQGRRSPTPTRNNGKDMSFTTITKDKFMEDALKHMSEQGALPITLMKVAQEQPDWLNELMTKQNVKKEVNVQPLHAQQVPTNIARVADTVLEIEERMENITLIEKTLDVMQTKFEALTFAIQKLEDTIGQNIILIKKREATMKGFYEGAKLFINNVEAEAVWKAKVSQYCSAGPVIVIKPRLYDDCKPLLDRMKTAIMNQNMGDKMAAQFGNGPLIIDLPARMMFQALKDGVEREQKITTWFPKGLKDPSFSLHIDGKCVVSAALDTENVMTIAVEKQVGTQAQIAIRNKFEQLMSDKAYLFPMAHAKDRHASCKVIAYLQKPPLQWWKGAWVGHVLALMAC